MLAVVSALVVVVRAGGEWRGLRRQEAELLQHELDHLDGVLAVDRAASPDDIVPRAEYLARRAEYDAQVDYVIVPTV